MTYLIIAVVFLVVLMAILPKHDENNYNKLHSNI